MTSASASDRAWAILVARTMLGVVFFVAGFYKTFLWGPLEHARLLFVQPYANTFLPVWALWASGAAIPVVELVTGLCVLVGLWTRPALFVLGAILVFVAFGHLLVQPSTSINAFILPRSALLLIVLLTPADAGWFALDHVLKSVGSDFNRTSAGRLKPAPTTNETAALSLKMTSRSTSLERAWAIFVTRTILGLVFLFAGVHKLADPGALEFGRRMMLTDGARFVSGPVAMVAGTLTPFLELAIGVLLLAGLWTRPTLRAVAVLVIGITIAYGVHGLRHPTGATAMNISVVNFYILPRAALIIVMLFLDRDDDVLTLERMLDALRAG